MADPTVTAQAFPTLAAFTSQGLPATLGFMG
jgi:hypothetical protein